MLEEEALLASLLAHPRAPMPLTRRLLIDALPAGALQLAVSRQSADGRVNKSVEVVTPPWRCHSAAGRGPSHSQLTGGERIICGSQPRQSVTSSGVTGLVTLTNESL